ncbi:Pentatricopeptide repeat-containing protein, chloroplastic, partial [Cucurbita argyrosperma subsp. sororia]
MSTNHDEFGGVGRYHIMVAVNFAVTVQCTSGARDGDGYMALIEVEARIVVLAVLRMIKENYALGESVKDDIFIILGVSKVEPDLVEQNFEVRDAITKLLQYELGLEVLPAGPTTVPDEVAGSESSNMSLTKLNGIMGRNKYTTRKPAAVQRLKVTKKSLKDWLQRNRDIIEYRLSIPKNDSFC